MIMIVIDSYSNYNSVSWVMGWMGWKVTHDLKTWFYYFKTIQHNHTGKHTLACKYLSSAYAVRVAWLPESIIFEKVFFQILPSKNLYFSTHDDRINTCWSTKLTILQSRDMKHNETATTVTRTATSFTITNHHEHGTTANSQTINSHLSNESANQSTDYQWMI